MPNKKKKKKNPTYADNRKVLTSYPHFILIWKILEVKKNGGLRIIF